MTHEYSGKYAAKHPQDTPINERIAEMIRAKSQGNRLACGTAEMISNELGVEMSEVGITSDLLEIKIEKCQLGLFGYGNKPDHGKDIHVAGSVSDEIKKALEDTAVNGKVSCAELWSIADRLGIKRKEVSSACEALKLKIKECQLGAF